MDPNEALRIINHAMKTGTMLDEASWAAEGLADWTGFAPDMPRILAFEKLSGMPYNKRNLKRLADDFEEGLLPRITLTYGVLPPRSEVIKRAAASGDPYRYHMKGRDADVMESIGFDAGPDALSPTEVWQVINKLTKRYDRGDDDAGNLASSFLETLNIEWI